MNIPSGISPHSGLIEINLADRERMDEDRNRQNQAVTESKYPIFNCYIANPNLTISDPLMLKGNVVQTNEIKTLTDMNVLLKERD